MPSLLRDVRHGIRSLRTSAGLTLIIVAVLGLGIGATVAMFTVIDATFLRPLRLPEPERLVQIQETSPTSDDIPVSLPDFVDWQRQQRSFESMGYAATFQETLRASGGNELIRVAYASPAFHATYGVKPVAGRLLMPEDEAGGTAPVAVLAYRFWQTHFGGDRAVIGRKFIVDDQVWTIAGVASPFDWNRKADVFVPVTFARSKWGLSMREQHSSSGVTARLKRGVTIEQARSEMKLIAARLAAQYPDSNGGIGVMVAPLRDYIGGSIRHAALLMFGAVALLLLVACANVAGLLLARAAVRERDFAIRIAMGASRLQLVRQLLIESLLLAVASAAAGVAVAALGLAALERIFPAAGNLGGIGLDARVLVFSLAVAMLTAVLFGLAPALQFTRPNVTEAMKVGGRASHGGAPRLRTRKVLVVSQVAVAVILFVGAGLLARSFLEALRTEPGFRPEHVVVASVMPADHKNMDISRNCRLLRDLAEQLGGAPGVLSAGGINSLPFSNADSWGQFYRDDRPIPPADQLPNAMHAAATPGYFRTMGIPLLKGRLFTAADGQMPPTKRDTASLLAYIHSVSLVAVINESMARKFWSGEDPIGKSFRFGPPSLKGPRVTILGVVGNAKQFSLDRPVEPQYFFSADQFLIFEARLVIRTQRDVGGLAAMIRKTVAEYDPDAVVSKVESMETLVDNSLTNRQHNLMLLGLFSGVTLLLAAVGLYAMMAYAVARRTHEIGLRMALGAQSGDVRGMVLRESAWLAAAGIIIGLVTATLGARFVSSMLYGVAATDSLTYAGSALLLLGIMLIAGFIPAWRASRVDPMVALRAE